MLLGLRGSSTGTLVLVDVPVSPEDVVGRVGSGMTLMRQNHEVLMNPGLLALGIANAAYDQARQAVSGRWLGVPATGSQQHARFTLAEIETALGSAYAYAAAAVRSVHAATPRCDIECLKVKAHASATGAAVSHGS